MAKLVAHYERCPYKPLFSSALSSESPATGPTGGDAGDGGGSGPTVGATGWIEWVSQNASVTYPWDEVLANLNVPTAPSNHVSDAGVAQTLYYFQGLQSDEADPPSYGCGILQPVLQWGASPAGGGEYWSFDSWWWSTGFYGSGTNGYYGTLVTSSVDTGHEILSEMYIEDYYSTYIWVINVEDTVSGNSAGILVDDECSYDNYFVTFEVDSSLGGIANCGEVPHATNFYNVGLYTAAPSLLSFDAVTQDVSYHFQSGLISCQWAESSGTTGGPGQWVTLTQK